MSKKLRTHEDFDNRISNIIIKRKKIKKASQKLAETQKQLRKCEIFFRGLMRTHLRFPEINEIWPQYFFQDQDGTISLVQELMGPNTENLMPKMKRIPFSQAQRARMTNGHRGFVIYVCPAHNFDSKHSRFIVDFEREIAEPYEKNNGSFHRPQII